MVPRENKNNAYAKFWRANKEYYGIFESGLFGNFTLSFGRLRHRIPLKCVPHVQHDYFSSFNQSDHCFLPLSMPLSSSLLKLSINSL